MSDLYDHRSLSRVELIVLARLTTPKAPTRDDIAKALMQIGVPLKGHAVADCVEAALTTLQRRALVLDVAVRPEPKPVNPVRNGTRKRKTPPKPPKPPKPVIARFALTDDGRLALQHALRVDVAPTWEATCTSVVPALALGLEVGSEAANAALRSVDAMATALLRRDPALGNPGSVAELCDQVIAKALGMPPGPATSDGIRAFALAMHCGVDSKAELSQIAAGFRSATSATKPGSQLKVLGAGFVRKQLGVVPTRKPAMVKALQHRWMSQHDQADEAHRVTAAWATPLRPSSLASESAARSAMSPAPGAAEDKLLAAVRAAIPVIGAAGRYGKENVFVSALWQHLVRERRADLSLDGFKRWLVAANREQQVDLARADLVDAMNGRLVEDSAIEDLGATFHFVVDRGQISSEQVTHA